MPGQPDWQFGSTGVGRTVCEVWDPVAAPLFVRFAPLQDIHTYYVRTYITEKAFSSFS